MLDKEKQKNKKALANAKAEGDGDGDGDNAEAKSPTKVDDYLHSHAVSITDILRHRSARLKPPLLARRKARSPRRTPTRMTMILRRRPSLLLARRQRPRRSSSKLSLMLRVVVAKVKV
jgi:hypothetical protein